MSFFFHTIIVLYSEVLHLSCILKLTLLLNCLIKLNSLCANAYLLPGLHGTNPKACIYMLTIVAFLGLFHLITQSHNKIISLDKNAV